MSDELRVGISVGVGLLILLSGYIFSFFDVKFGKAKFIEIAKAKGNCTQGYIIKDKFIPGDETSENEEIRSNTMRITYEYVVNGVKYKKKMSFQSPGMVTIKFPIVIDVYYDPRNPKKAVCKEEATRAIQQRTGCLLSFVFATVAIAVLLNILKLF